MFAPWWQENQDFSSTLVIRNMHLRAPASATPVLYATNGRETRLNTIQLAPNSVQKISIDAALRAVGTWAPSGALALEYDAPSPAAITAQLISEDEQHSLIYAFPLRSTYPAPQNRTLQATWWIPADEDKATLVLFNASTEPIVAHASVAVNQASQVLADFFLEPHEVRDTDFRRLLREKGIRGTAAGLLTLTHEGPEEALSPALLFFNQDTGFSLVADFSSRVAGAPGEATTLHAPMALVNKPDPRMGFEDYVQMTPYAIASNTTQDALPVVFNASYEVAGQGGPRTVTLPLAPLAPMETRVVNLGEYVAAGLIPREVGAISLEISYPGANSALALRVFSMDPEANYVYAAVIQEATVRTDVTFWDVQGDENSIITVRNISDSEVPVRITLSDNNGQGSYELPAVAVPARGTRTVYLREVLASGAPDAKGNVIPAGVKQGSAKVEAADGHSKPRLVTIAAVFNPLIGICGEIILPCIGVINVFLFSDPTVGLVGDVSSVVAFADWNDGSETNVTLDAGLQSGDSGIISVAPDGGVQFLGVGNTNISGSLSLPTEPIKVGLDCGFFFFFISALAESRPTVAITSALNFAFVGSDPTIPRVLYQAVGNPSGGAYSWSASPANRVSFDNPSVDVIRLSGINPSTSVTDTGLTVNYTVNGVSANPPATRNITVRIFRLLEQSGQTQIIPQANGYIANAFYNVFTNPSKQILQPGFGGIRVFESVALQSATRNGVPLTQEERASITSISGSGSTDQNGQIVDNLSLLNTSGGTLPSGLVLTSSQDIFVGGFFVRSNTIEQRSENIVNITNLGPTT